MPNPFLEPRSLLVDKERQRQRRFKVAVYLSLGGLAVLLTGLLIEGCQRHQTGTEVPAEPGPEATTPLSQTGALAAAVPETNFPAPAVPTPDSTTSPPPASVTPPAVVSSAPAKEPPAAAPAASVTESVYIIKRGDTLGKIAKTHGTTIAAIKEANGLKSDRIIAGHKLKLPTTAPAPTASTNSP